MNKRKEMSETSAINSSKKPKTGHWSMGLLETVNDPKYFVKSDDLVNIITDKYPKARFHYLILPKDNITSIKSVDKTHADLLKHMEDVALELTRSKKHENCKFKIGYHAEPSMTRLHLHVISDDMNSDCLKTKKHWNSFTTDFFLKSEDVRQNLEKNGKVILPSKEDIKKFINADLKCHKCDFKPKNMPALKKHILVHS